MKPLQCKSLAALCLLLAYTNPVYAIPPPETLAFLGGSLIYSGLILIGMISILCKYVWIKTRLYLCWRLYMPWVVVLLIAALCVCSLYLIPPLGIKNTAVLPQTLIDWQATNTKFTLIDLRDRSEYDKMHLAGALNFPDGIGLDNYLNTNKDKNIVLYCRNGFKSASLTGLDTNPHLLKKIQNEHRLFYIPGGINQLAEPDTSPPVPIVINIPAKYAHYLSQQHSFATLPLPADNDRLSMTAYQQAIAKNQIPIVNSSQSHDLLAAQFRNKFQVNHAYFLSTSPEPSFALANYLIVLALILTALFFLRKQELIKSMVAKIPPWYPLTDLPLSLLMMLSTIFFTMQLTFPLDIYLYEIAHLPLNPLCFLVIYVLFTLVLGIHLLCPKKKRLELLRSKLSSAFTATKMKQEQPQLSWKELIMLGLCLASFYLIPLPLPSIFIISVFMALPLLVDATLYALISLVRNSDENALSLLKRCRYACYAQGTPVIGINTQSEFSLGTLKISMETQHIYAGLFTGMLFHRDGTQPAPQILEHYNLNHANLMRQLAMVRNLLILFQQDIEIALDNDLNVVAIKLAHNANDSRVITRCTLLKHHQMFPEITAEQRFSSLALQETFANPSPLLLSILKKRWSNQGGYLKALRKLGLLIKKNDLNQEQFIGFCNQIYIDNVYEQAIFSKQKWLARIRQKVVQLHFQLAAASIRQDYHTLMAPRMQLKIAALGNSLQQPLSSKQRQRIIKRALTDLYQRSAKWQFYSSLVHQDAFRQLQIATNGSGLIHSLDISSMLSTPSYYELSEQPDLKKTWRLHANTAQQHTFLNSEYVRTHLRQLQLKEWQLINLHLECLTQQLQVPLSLTYLTVNELCHRPRKHRSLSDLLQERHRQWTLQQEYQLPALFSLQDIEQLPLNSTTQLTTASSQSPALRVAGSASVYAGTAVFLKEGLRLETLERHSILIAENISPEQLVACQHIKGVLLSKGSYLSHSAIIAREKNMLMLAQVPIASFNEHDKLIIHSGNQVTVLSHQVIEWSFLETKRDNVTIGNKAQRLALLSHQRFNIPDSILLEHESIKKIYTFSSTSPQQPQWQQYDEELKQLFTLLAPNCPLIVRSSTNLEDASAYSYAGLFYSQANIHSLDELITAIRSAWENMLQRAALVKEYSGELELSLHLMIQPYIKGQAGGVLFTASETPDLMRLEIARNGSEGVTSGNAALACLQLDAQGQICSAQGETNLLNKRQYQELYRVGRQLETLFGTAQDIEWIFSGQQLYVIQCRDISDKGRLPGLPQNNGHNMP